MINNVAGPQPYQKKQNPNFGTLYKVPNKDLSDALNFLHAGMPKTPQQAEMTPDLFQQLHAMLSDGLFRRFAKPGEPHFFNYSNDLYEVSEKNRPMVAFRDRSVLGGLGTPVPLENDALFIADPDHNKYILVNDQKDSSPLEILFHQLKKKCLPE